MARHPHYAHGTSNVLATVPSDPEVIAVFPELSSTIIPHQQDIRLRRGDTLDIQVQVQNDEDPPQEFNIGGCVLRWAAKQGFGETERRDLILGNDAALIVKRSYNPAEIKTVNSGKGQAIIHLKKADTAGLSASPTVWDLELTKPIEEFVPPTGASVALLLNSRLVRANNFSWVDLGVAAGDLFKAQNLLVLVTRFVSSMVIEVDYQGWSSDSYAPFQAWRGNVKTVAGGTFRVTGDVII
jgi:hypothetical protein